MTTKAYHSTIDICILELEGILPLVKDVRNFLAGMLPQCLFEHKQASMAEYHRAALEC